jgi:hypothetical protein
MAVAQRGLVLRYYAKWYISNRKRRPCWDSNFNTHLIHLMLELSILKLALELQAKRRNKLFPRLWHRFRTFDVPGSGPETRNQARVEWGRISGKHLEEE